MAYYSSSYFEDDLIDYNQNPYPYSYDSSPTQSFLPYSSYESNDNQFFDYNAVPYYGSYNPHSYSSIAHSASTFPNPYSGHYSPGQTQFVISYSTVVFNEPEFEEYDPTPYGGGYDIAQTYGKPLSPSDEICYPRSKPDPNASSLDGISLGSIVLPREKEEGDGKAAKPSNGSERALAKEEEQKVYSSSDKGHDSLKEEPHQGQRSDQENDYDKLVAQPPSGYGLEAMDLCESLFGYWPCLSREKRRCGDGQECADHQEGSNSDLWKGSADYLFGSSNPYGERRDVGGSYGDPNYGYQRHYQEEPLFMQVDYDEDSW